MSATICPTITATSPVEFGRQLERVLPFAGRIHIDLMDGEFAQPQSISLDEAYWPANVACDLHIMYKRPFGFMQELIALRPQLVIVHAEAEGDFLQFAQVVHQHGIEVGVALLPQTLVEDIASALEMIDHVLVFSGRLGHQGGVADLRFLHKVKQLRSLKPALEIGWDGGVSSANARELAEGGVDVLNVGGAIQYATDPQQAYDKLESLV